MSGVLTFASQQLRGAWRRNAIAGATILVAVSSFVVLTGTSLPPTALDEPHPWLPSRREAR